MEFRFADKMYLRYSNTGDEKYLDKLIGTIYRPAAGWFDKSGEKRLPFNNNFIEKYASRLSRLSYAEKQLILLWYIGCRTAIVEGFSDVFDTKTVGNEESDWMDLIMAMSGNKFGTFTETSNTNFLLILTELREIKKRKPIIQ
jgi:hypothetical protein